MPCEVPAALATAVLPLWDNRPTWPLLIALRPVRFQLPWLLLSCHCGIIGRPSHLHALHLIWGQPASLLHLDSPSVSTIHQVILFFLQARWPTLFSLSRYLLIQAIIFMQHFTSNCNYNMTSPLNNVITLHLQSETSLDLISFICIGYYSYDNYNPYRVFIYS